MVHAFIMVTSGAGESQQLLTPIRALEGVTEAHIVAGAYDLIVEADGEEVYDIFTTATNGIQGLQGVTETKTYISLED